MNLVRKITITFILLIFAACFCKAQVFRDIHNAQKIDQLAARYYFGLPSDSTNPVAPFVSSPGALFYNLTDSIVYKWNGASWNPLSGSFPGVTLTQLNDSLATKVSIKDSGTIYLTPNSNIISLAAGASSYTVPANTLIEKFFVKESTSISLDIGTTMSGTEIVSGAPITTGYGIININKFFLSSTIIYFTNVTGSTVIKIYKN